MKDIKSKSLKIQVNTCLIIILIVALNIFLINTANEISLSEKNMLKIMFSGVLPSLQNTTLIVINLISIITIIVLIFGVFSFTNKSQKQYEEILNLKNKLSYDSLTGLLNKTMLNEELKNSKNAKLLLIDLDEFRNINNFFSYEVGDEVLKHIASKLQIYANNNNLLAYSINADLFALYHRSDEPEEFYLNMIEDIKKIIEFEPFFVASSDTSIILTLSMGLSLQNKDCFKKAYIALKDAKKSGKSFTCYTEKLENTQHYQNQIAMTNIVKKALDNNKIIPFYQPIVDKNGKIIKYEALARLIKENAQGEELIMPMNFLPTSIKLKHYSDIQTLMLKAVAKKLKKHQDIQIALNMSARDMNDANFNEIVINTITQNNIAKNLVIEVLENEDISKNTRILSFLQKLRKLGCKIAIDDFGTGYSNFSYLLEFNPDYIKIDGSLIKNIDTNKQNYNIVKLIVAFAKNANMKVVAEHVHSKEIYEICQEIGIDEFQGYYLGQPQKDL